jgi:photosystem II stability/assembly factor-like uncharacterized protein
MGGGAHFLAVGFPLTARPGTVYRTMDGGHSWHALAVA